MHADVRRRSSACIGGSLPLKIRYGVTFSGPVFPSPPSRGRHSFHFQESNDQLALADDVALNKGQQARLVQSGRERETRVKGVYRKAVVVLLIRLRIRTVISRTFTFEIRDALNDPGKFCRSMNNLITW